MKLGIGYIFNVGIIEDALVVSSPIPIFHTLVPLR